MEKINCEKEKNEGTISFTNKTAREVILHTQGDPNLIMKCLSEIGSTALAQFKIPWGFDLTYPIWHKEGKWFCPGKDIISLRPEPAVPGHEKFKWLVFGYIAGGATLWALIQLGFLLVRPLLGPCGGGR